MKNNGLTNRKSYKDLSHTKITRYVLMDEIIFENENVAAEVAIEKTSELVQKFFDDNGIEELKGLKITLEVTTETDNTIEFLG